MGAANNAVDSGENTVKNAIDNGISFGSGLLNTNLKDLLRQQGY